MAKHGNTFDSITEAGIDQRVAALLRDIASEVPDDDLAEVLDNLAAEIGEGALAKTDDDVDAFVEHVLADANAALLKMRGWSVRERNSDPDLTRRLVEMVATLKEIAPELPLVKQKNAAEVLVRQFEHEIATLEKLGGIRKEAKAEARCFTKARDSRLNIIWKRFTAAARQAGYDPGNRDELLKFAANEGLAIAEEYVAAGGKEFRKLTRREGL